LHAKDREFYLIQCCNIEKEKLKNKLLCVKLTLRQACLSGRQAQGDSYCHAELAEAGLIRIQKAVYNILYLTA